MDHNLLLKWNKGIVTTKFVRIDGFSVSHIVSYRGCCVQKARRTDREKTRATKVVCGKAKTRMSITTRIQIKFLIV